MDQLQPWDPAQEEERKAKSWGQTQQKVGERYSRAGLTGSSQELGDLANTAKNFELDWDERAPKQRGEAIASVLPIENFRRSVANDFTDESYKNRLLSLQGETADQALWGNLLASSGLPTWLASALFGTSTPAAGYKASGLIPQGASALYNYLFSGGSNGVDPNLDAFGKTFDWGADVMGGMPIDYSYLFDTSANAPTDIANVLGGLSLEDLTGYW
jgi:hypothetical protein